MNSIELCDVTKRFGAMTAVDRVSLIIDEPGVVAMLGPNGAGKTTTIDMLLGLRRPTSGSVRIFGIDPSVARVRERIGCAPQQSGVPESLRVREILEFVAQQYPRAFDVSQTLSDFGLTQYARRQAGVLSGGELRRLTLALAFIGMPDLVMLDEPTNGLDLEARRGVWDYIRAYAAGGGTVLLTTHHMEEAEALASRIVVLNNGRIVRDGSAQEIRRSGTRRVSYVDSSGSKIVLSTDDSDTVVRELVRSDVAFSDLCVTGQSLEDAILSLFEEAV
ncbi:MAG TPA: ABC transporter ATP-binding protein [Candidatus Baltobacteraceae bacterium]|nr:ABC transporter ATP-binding protein [Candidatus Baltobacteraceae bacterium]